MKVVILAGGLGTRMGNGPRQIPKPLVEVGDKPVLAHLIQLCAMQGAAEFIIALGHNANKIEDYFRNASSAGLCAKAHDERPADWHVSLVDTGLETMTGGRLKRLSPWLRDEPYFLMTYADGLADINLSALERFHLGHGKLATITAVRVPERFGRVQLDGDVVASFQEKPHDGPWINGGFFILSPKVLDYIEDDTTIWEREPLRRLCDEGQLHAFRHEGFWSCLDTHSDLTHLQSLWHSGAAPWRLERQVR